MLSDVCLLKIDMFDYNISYKQPNHHSPNLTLLKYIYIYIRVCVQVFKCLGMAPDYLSRPVATFRHEEAVASSFLVV